MFASNFCVCSVSARRFHSPRRTMRRASSWAEWGPLTDRERPGSDLALSLSDWLIRVNCTRRSFYGTDGEMDKQGIELTDVVGRVWFWFIIAHITPLTPQSENCYKFSIRTHRKLSRVWQGVLFLWCVDLGIKTSDASWCFHPNHRIRPQIKWL